MLNLMKKSAPTTTKTAIQITPNQKATTTVANVAGKVKTGAFGVATGAGIAGTMMLQNEKSIRNRKAREAYHKRVEQVCTVAVGAAIVGAGAAVVQSIFDPIVDVSMLEIEPAAYVELNDKGSDIQEAREAAQNSNAAEHAEDEGAAEDDKAEIVHEQNAEQHVEKVVAEIVQTEQHADPTPKAAEKPIVEATATEVESEQAPAAPADKQPASVDPAPVAPKTEQPVAPAPKDVTPAPAPAAPADPAPVATAGQTNQGNNAQQPKSDAGKQQPKDNGQGASNNNPKNGNNHAKAAK